MWAGAANKQQAAAAAAAEPEYEAQGTTRCRVSISLASMHHVSYKEQSAE
jgi:hypothetical protein